MFGQRDALETTECVTQISIERVFSPLFTRWATSAVDAGGSREELLDRAKSVMEYGSSKHEGDRVLECAERGVRQLLAQHAVQGEDDKDFDSANKEVQLRLRRELEMTILFVTGDEDAFELRDSPSPGQDPNPHMG